jgi:hypothetical protein
MTGPHRILASSIFVSATFVGAGVACTGAPDSPLFDVSASGCSTLSMCCVGLGTDQMPTCDRVAGAGDDGECTTELSVLQSLGFCGGVGTSTSTGTGTGSGSGSTSTTVTTTPPATSLLLFGGYGVNEVDLDDTWSWDGAAWTEVASTGPTPRDGSVIGALGTSLFLFGGGAVRSEGAVLGDMWKWSSATPVWAPVSTVGPPARAGAVMGNLNGTLVLFGGYEAGDIDGADTWVFDGVAWTEVKGAGPSARDSAVMAPLGQQLVLFGGGSHGNLESQLSDTWVWDGTSWTEITTSNSPSPRAGAVMGELNGELILFGGYGFGHEDLSDTWAWNGATWEELDVTGPSARDSAVMGELNGELVLFGGNATTTLGDTWTFNGSAWSLADAATFPPPRAGAVMGGLP